MQHDSQCCRAYAVLNPRCAGPRVRGCISHTAPDCHIIESVDSIIKNSTTIALSSCKHPISSLSDFIASKIHNVAQEYHERQFYTKSMVAK